MSNENSSNRVRKAKPKNTGIGMRMTKVLEQEITHTRLTTLEKMSGIGKTSWGNALSGVQKPTHEMIEWVCKQFPQYAYWIATGTLPDSNLHTTPRKAKFETSGLTVTELLKIEPIKLTEEQLIYLVEETRNTEVDRLNVHLKVRKSGKSFDAYYAANSRPETNEDDDKTRRILEDLEFAYDAWKDR